jgi:hypothetical protein
LSVCDHTVHAGNLLRNLTSSIFCYH